MLREDIIVHISAIKIIQANIQATKIIRMRFFCSIGISFKEQKKAEIKFLGRLLLLLVLFRRLLKVNNSYQKIISCDIIAYYDEKV